MKLVNAFLLFYSRLWLPAFIIALTYAIVQLPLTDHFPFAEMGKAYIPLALLVQFFEYELSHPEQYYFYYNLGLSKISLYLLNFGFSLGIGLTIILLF